MSADFSRHVRAYAARWYGDPTHRLSKDELRRLVIRRAILRRERVVARDERRGPGLRRQREVRFVRDYLRRTARFLKDNGRVPKRKEAIVLADQSTLAIGHEHRHGRRMLGLPRIQAAMYDALCDAGLDMKESAAIIVDIAKAEPKQPVYNKDGDYCGDRVDAGILSAKLNAVGLAAKLTTGFAVAKSAQLVGTYKTDKMFQAGEEKFANPPAMGEGETP